MKRGLGKGFGSLLPDDFDNSVLLNKDERIQKVLIQDIKPDPNQPRRSFDTQSISELAQSIKQYGILQPLVVIQDNNNYIIVAGERRYKAAIDAGLSHLPVIVRSLQELERLEIGLVENMQRVDLNPLDQALSIARLNEQFSMNIEQIAERLGKATTTVINIVRLLELPDFAREALYKGKISEGHARSVLSLTGNQSMQKMLVDNIVNQGWSVRKAEEFARDNKTSNPKKPNSKKVTSVSKQAQDKNYQDSLKNKYGGSVKISHSGKVHKVTFSFKTNKEFTQFLDEVR